MVTVHVGSVPAQSPPHPVNVDVASGAAVRVTTVPVTKVSEQVPGQLMTPGELVTVPPPVPRRGR